jgi:hypothetical protein
MGDETFQQVGVTLELSMGEARELRDFIDHEYVGHDLTQIDKILHTVSDLF